MSFSSCSIRTFLAPRRRCLQAKRALVYFGLGERERGREQKIEGVDMLYSQLTMCSDSKS